MSKVKASMEGDTLVLRAYGKTLYTRYANGYHVYHNVTLTPSLQKELQERINESK